MNNEIKIFEGNKIRSAWDAEKDAGAYWRKLKQRLKDEGSEVVTFCHELKMHFLCIRSVY